jgi:hypothetical protein
MLHHVAVGIFDIDDDHIGHQRFDDSRDAVDLMHDGDARMPCLAQAFFDDGGANGIFVDHQNCQIEMRHGYIHGAVQQIWQARQPEKCAKTKYA